MANPSLIFDIKRYAINDGPGIRVTFFFKGCPLSCVWCHNPEGMSRKVQKMYTERKCIGAQECIRVCEVGALTLTPQGIVTDIDKCTLCGDCSIVCPTKAIEMSGEEMTIQEIMNIIKRERTVINQSGGGVTFSGGEPLHHHRILLELLEACGKEGLHRCVDTTGFANQHILLEVAKHTDLFLYDIKMMDPVKHKKYTGVSNEKILGNLIALSSFGANIIIRIPLISGINDDEENLRQTVAFLSALPQPVQKVELLPYHPIALNKYIKLGQIYEYNDLKAPDQNRVEWAEMIFNAENIITTIA